MEDADGIIRLNHAFGFDYPPEKTRAKLEKALKQSDQRAIVAVLDDKLIGYIHLEDYDTLYFDPMKNVLGLTVLPEYRRLGAASALLAAADQWAKETGAAGIRLDSGIERKPAHACYEKNGYVERKLHKNQPPASPSSGPSSSGSNSQLCRSHCTLSRSIMPYKPFLMI